MKGGIVGVLCALAWQIASAQSLPNLEAFVDGLVSASMAHDAIAGVQVAVVRNGEVLLAKGYGTESIEPNHPVDPDQTLFRIGSISKTLTWIALMQLAERGRLELDDPINDHLPDELDVPDEGFERPIRVIDLMNHAAGFEELLQGLFVASDAPLLSLGEQLSKRRPQRVREPGRRMAYSNYGAALAGAIVAHVSGMDYESYVEQSILQPLGMMQTTFREQYASRDGLPQPMSAELAAHMAQNIETLQGAWQALPHEHIVSMAPAGSAVSTAADMARYMLALLDPQLLEAKGVLKAATFAQMREPSLQSAPGMPAIHHGFFNTPLGIGERLGFDNLSHAGATLHFRSFMVVTDDLGDQGTLGVYVAANSAPAQRMVFAVAEQIFAKYFRPAPEPFPDGRYKPSDLREYTGQYRSTRRSYTQFEKIVTVGAMPIVATPDGALTLRLFGPELRLVPISKDLFRQPDGDVTIAFLRDERGAITHLITPIGEFDRVGFFMSQQWLALMVAVALLACIGILIAAVLRREPVGVVTVTAIAWLLFIFLMIAWVLPLAGPQGLDQFIYTYPQPLLKLALAVGVVATGLSVLGIATLVPVWRERTWPIGRRLRHSAAVALFIALVATLSQWNAIGFRYY
jgi:CubicO group peptidase (beta-lactamase class C family)